MEQIGRVRSDVELISGSFEVPCEGVLFFIWVSNYKMIEFRLDNLERSHRTTIMIGVLRKRSLT